MMVSFPAASDWVVQEATLLLLNCITGTGMGHSGIGLPLLVKVTLPVGSPLLAVTVAINVTDWFTSDGLREEMSCVVVVKEPPVTVCIVVPLLAVKLLSPL